MKTLVIGGGACVWADVEQALEITEFDAVVACNDVGASWPGPVDAWVSLHPEKFKLWAARREKAGLEPAETVYGPDLGSTAKHKHVTHLVDYKFAGQRQTGSSGLFALKVALEHLGADKAVLCGVPMTTDAAHFFDPKAWRAAGSYKQGWAEALPQIRDRARSMSGWTAELLGLPDEEWLG